LARDEVLRVKGYTELLRACKNAERDSRLYVRHEFRAVGELVRSDAAQRFSSIDARSAAGFKVRVRQRGVSVEQSLRKTTGAHPDYGKLQMRRGLLPALAEKEDEVRARFEEAMGRVADRFET
jgi:hypothetical protein